VAVAAKAAAGLEGVDLVEGKDLVEVDSEEAKVAEDWAEVQAALGLAEAPVVEGLVAMEV
jgi:hypothetical protein